MNEVGQLRFLAGVIERLDEEGWQLDEVAIGRLEGILHQVDQLLHVSPKPGQLVFRRQKALTKHLRLIADVLSKYGAGGWYLPTTTLEELDYRLQQAATSVGFRIPDNLLSITWRTETQKGHSNA